MQRTAMLTIVKDQLNASLKQFYIWCYYINPVYLTYHYFLFIHVNAPHLMIKSSTEAYVDLKSFCANVRRSIHPSVTSVWWLKGLQHTRVSQGIKHTPSVTYWDPTISLGACCSPRRCHISGNIPITWKS